MSEIRVQKFLSQKGLYSRRQVEEFIRGKRLRINKRVATLGDRVSEKDVISLDGKKIVIPEAVKRIVLAFNKPKGIETTLNESAEGNKTLLDVDFGVGRVFPIGRLDKDSHGLLLLTNDGDLANKLMHPRYEKEKIYLVKLNKKIVHKDLMKLRTGISLNGKKTAPCQIENLENNGLKITLKEGRNRQIRRMFGMFNYEVLDLKRIKFGIIDLEDLKMGQWREVTDQF